MADILGSLEVTHIIEILDNKIILVIEILRIEKKDSVTPPLIYVPSKQEKN